MKTNSPIPLEIEALSQSLDFSTKDWDIAMQSVSRFGQDFLTSLKSAPAYRVRDRKKPGKESPPEKSEPLDSVLKDFTEIALRDGIEFASGNFFGYIPGGGMPAAAIGDTVAALTNRYSGIYEACPGSVEIENKIIRWIRDLLDWEEKSWGGLLSGGSLATLTAIVAARSTRTPEKWQKGVIYYGEETHHCFEKALKTAGLEASPLRKIPSDTQGRLSLSHLEKQIQLDKETGLEPWILCANAGTTNVGAIDPLETLSALCQREKIWFHVDAAYGGFFWLVEEGKKRLKGMEKADSLVLDPHKGLFQPYGIGAVLVRDAALLRKGFKSQAAYLQDVDTNPEHSPMDYTPELTRHFRALRLWFSLKLHGMDAFRAAIEEKLVLADWLYKELCKMSNCHVFAPPALSVVAFRCPGLDPNEANPKTEKVLKKILANGKIHLSSTTIHGYKYLRLCVLCFRTHFNEVETALCEIQGAL